MVSEKHVLNKKQVYLVNSLNIKKNEKKKSKGSAPCACYLFFYTGETNSMPNSSRLSELRKLVRLLALKQTTPMFIRTLANSSGQVVATSRLK